ncbi:MAG TPA: SIR2 family protein [Solirubrobacterales bacterium]
MAFFPVHTVTIDAVKAHLQGFVKDGLVTVIGLGHSASLGLPTMPQLADHLRGEMPVLLQGEEVDEWQAVESALDEGRHLEPALDAVAHDGPVTDKIIAVAANSIATAESVAIERISRDPNTFPLARLIDKIGFSGKVRIITTNYDRLIELAAEMAGLMLDTGFTGAHHGRYDVERSREALRATYLRGRRKLKAVYRPHVVLAKPHGSLDWYQGPNGPIRSPYPLDLPRLMITPGESKYRHGYEQPFDHHIALANEAIDAASAVLAIGFGFNDPHLQTHLVPRIERGLPTLILTRNLTEAAAALVTKCPNVCALDRAEAGGGTRVQWDGNTQDFPDIHIWQLDNFIDEVLT